LFRGGRENLRKTEKKLKNKKSKKKPKKSSFTAVIHDRDKNSRRVQF
jgi:hypothetical protein